MIITLQVDTHDESQVQQALETLRQFASSELFKDVDPFEQRVKQAGYSIREQTIPWGKNLDRQSSEYAIQRGDGKWVIVLRRYREDSKLRSVLSRIEESEGYTPVMVVTNRDGTRFDWKAFVHELEQADPFA